MTADLKFDVFIRQVSMPSVVRALAPSQVHRHTPQPPLPNSTNAATNTWIDIHGAGCQRGPVGHWV